MQLAHEFDSLAKPSSKQRPDQRIHFFSQGAADGRSADRALLGGKGADLAEMCRLGLPVRRTEHMPATPS